MARPSTNGSNGRDARGRDERGRFAKGNPGGPGNPNAQHVAKLRDGFLSACSVADVRAICRKLVAMAKRGNVLAAREVLDRTIGKPATVLEHLADDTPGMILPVLEVLVRDSNDVLEFSQLREMMQMQLRQTDARVLPKGKGLPAPAND